ncbi:MAG: hypothetical protein ACON38_20295 [Akkermansiaceae bacterium]
MSTPSKRDFKKFRNPRPGTSNPQDLTNPYWVWCVENKGSGYANNEKFNGPCSFDAGPAWCCDRFGQTTTNLPDGTKVLVAGEHEDHYDPDFHIYNDVIVVDPDGQVRIYGYPENVFPPTDFHSATLVGNEVILIGSLGYPDQRNDQETQVLRLSLTDWSIASQPTSNPPGWISHHQAKACVDQKSISVTGLQRWTEVQGLFDDFSTWELDLTSWEWRCVEEKNWSQYRLFRRDEEYSNLWRVRLSVGLEDLDEKTLKKMKPDLLPLLYRPTLPHTEIVPPEPSLEDLENDDFDPQYNHFRISVDDVDVLFIEDHNEVVMRIEGQLPEQKVAQILKDVCHNLGELEGAPYHHRKLP